MNEENDFKAALLLIYDVLISKEQERKSSVLLQTSAHRDGLDCMNFFMDLINHAAGYSHKYYDENHTRLTTEDLIQKYRAEYKKINNDTKTLNKSELLGDRYPHCLLAIEGAHTLYRMKECGNLARDYLDTLILRLNVS